MHAYATFARVACCARDKPRERNAARAAPAKFPAMGHVVSELCTIEDVVVRATQITEPTSDGAALAEGGDCANLWFDAHVQGGRLVLDDTPHCQARGRRRREAQRWCSDDRNLLFMTMCTDTRASDAAAHAEEGAPLFIDALYSLGVA